MSLAEEGLGQFRFADEVSAKSLTVSHYRPEGSALHAPVVVLLHGSDRAAPYLLDCWRDSADEHGFVLLAPEFDQQAFPGGETYNYGNVRCGNVGPTGAPEGAFKSPETWTYGILDRLLDWAREKLQNAPTKWGLFGHSAGAQFAHRFLALTGGVAIDITVLANAGWYMMPDPSLRFPAGLGGLGLPNETVDRYLGSVVTLLLGENDVDERDPGLAPFPAAQAQGRHRLARGTYYFERCRDLAGQRGVPFGWRMITAPGVGHLDDQVAKPGAALFVAYFG